MEPEEWVAHCLQVHWFTIARDVKTLIGIATEHMLITVGLC